MASKWHDGDCCSSCLEDYTLDDGYLYYVYVGDERALLLPRRRGKQVTLTNTNLRATVTAALRLQQLLDAAAEAQWQPSVTPTPREDTSERSKGGHSDPTSAVVSDDRRLHLRAAVMSAEANLTAFVGTLEAQANSLAKALARWEGE